MVNFFDILEVEKHILFHLVAMTRGLEGNMAELRVYQSGVYNKK